MILGVCVRVCVCVCVSLLEKCTCQAAATTSQGGRGGIPSNLKDFNEQ